MTNLLLLLAITLLIAILYQLQKLRGIIMPVNDFSALNAATAKLQADATALKTTALDVSGKVSVQAEIDSATNAVLAATATIAETQTILGGILPPPPPPVE